MSHLPDTSSYASESSPYATARGGGMARPGGHDNEFRNSYASSDFSSGAAGGGAAAAHHWSQPPQQQQQQPQQQQQQQQQQQAPYSAYAQNQFAGNGSSHPSYSSAMPTYGAHPGAPYSAFSMGQHPSHHSRPSHLHLGGAGQQGGAAPSQYGHHPESGPPTPNSATNMSHHNTPGGMGAYHSPSVAGVMPGMSHPHPGAPHQSYPSHYSASLVPSAGPASAMGGHPMASPSYPSAPQYSTQLPMAGRHRVTTTLWEDEGTLCFQVEAKGVCVARRHDNSMINGTKLLNVCGMSRGKRDGILKNEKERIVVKVGAMHLKGVWITFQRGKQLSEQNGIADMLYPLFEPNIQQFLYHPDNYPRTAAVMAAAQERQAKRMPDSSPSTANTSYDTSADHSSAWSRHPSNGGGGGYNLSAPATANQSPSHPAHPHSGYSTPSLQQHPQQQQQQSGNGAMPPGALRPVPVDRRHSMPLGANNGEAPSARDATGYGSASMDHPGAAGSHSHHAAAAALAGVGGGAPQARRTMSGTKREYDDGNDDLGGQQGGGGYGGMPGNGVGAGSDRLFKRGRGDVGDTSYDGGLDGGQHAYNGRGPGGDRKA